VTRLLPALDANGRRLIAAKALRAFGFGLNAVVLGLYLAELGLSAQIIGFVLAAALAGTLALTVVITLWGDRIGRRRLLVAGGALMALAAVIPLVGANPLLLVLIGLSGMVAVTGNESTGLQSVDQAMLPQTASDRQRTAAFALYNLVAAAAGALGALAVGPLLGLGADVGLDGAAAYAPAFAVYAVVGLVSAALAAAMGPTAEVGRSLEPGFAIRRSRGTVTRLSGLFAIDALAGGFVVQSYLAFWFSARHDLDAATIGTLFAVGTGLAAISFPVAAWLAARIGLIQTMVFTHIPSNLFLIGMALVPGPAWAAALFVARSALSSMDVPARQSYTMAVVEPDERTATAGVTSLARSAGWTLGPLVAGAALIPIGIGVPIIAGGALKTVYDLALFGLFRARPAPEEELRPGDA
jgi:MFS family permease